jgi:hypothetical protein
VPTDQRDGYYVLSIIAAEGELCYSLEFNNIDGQRYVEFLQQVLRARARPFIVIAGKAPFHCSVVVRRFVRGRTAGKSGCSFFTTHSPELNPDEQVWSAILMGTISMDSIIVTAMPEKWTFICWNDALYTCFLRTSD